MPKRKIEVVLQSPAPVKPAKGFYQCEGFFCHELDSDYDDFREMAVTLNYISSLRTWILSKFLKGHGLFNSPNAYTDTKTYEKYDYQKTLTLLKEVLYSDEWGGGEVDGYSYAFEAFG